MKYFDIKPQPTTGLGSFTFWLNDITSKFVTESITKKKIEVQDPPQVGDLIIQWFTENAQAEQSGEIVTIERWTGDFWEQHNLDSHHTVEDLIKLNEEFDNDYSY